MSFLDRLFPRKGQEESEEGERHEVQTRKKEDEPEDYLSLEHFEFRHPIKSMRKHMRLVRDGIYKGDKKAWHQFLMVSMVSMAGFCVMLTLCINFCFDLVSMRFQLGDAYMAKVISHSKASIYAQEKLFPGEYAIVHIFQSASFHDPAGTEAKDNMVALLASPKGGAVLAAAIPAGTEIPDEWLGSDSYTIMVDEDGNWSFRQAEDFEERREAMKKAREEYMARMMGITPQEDAQPSRQDADAQPPEDSGR